MTYDHVSAISPCSDFGEELSLVLGMSKPPQRFHASEYPESAYYIERPDLCVSEQPASHPMVREYTSMGWDGEDIENRFNTGKALEELPLTNANELERTKKGNSMSPWYQVSHKRSEASPSSNSIRDHETRTHTPLYTLKGSKSKSYPGGLPLDAGGPSWPSSASLSPSSASLFPPSSSPSSNSFLSSSMSNHSIRILTATTAQTRPRMTFLANASDISILAPSTIGIGCSSSVGMGRPGSLPESLEAECIDLTETGRRISHANESKGDKRHSLMSRMRTVGLETVEIITEEAPSIQPLESDPVYLNSYSIPPVHALAPPQTRPPVQGPKLKRAHTYANLKDVWKLASFPVGLIEASPDEEPVKQDNRAPYPRILESPAVIYPPSLGSPIDILPRPVSSTIAPNSITAHSPPTSHSHSSVRPAPMHSPPDADEEHSHVCSCSSPQTGSIRKIRRSPFQATRNSLRGMLSKSFKSRSLVHAFDNAEQNSQQRGSPLKSKISGPLLVRSAGDEMDRKKSDKEWREEVLKDVVGRTLSSRFRLLEETAKQQRESLLVKDKTDQKASLFGTGLKTRIPIPETLSSAVSLKRKKDPTNADSCENRMKMKSGTRPSIQSSLSLRMVTDETFTPKAEGLTS